MRVLILGHVLDPTINAVARAMGQRHGATTLRHVSLEQLARGHWAHRLSACGAVETRLDLGGGDIGDFDVVFNRIEAVTALRFDGWCDGDREYGRTEWLALLLSWLESLGEKVINRPAFGSLNGPADRAWRWLGLAAVAGLQPHPAGATTSTRRFPPMQGVLEHPALLAETIEADARIDRAMGYAVAATAIADVIVVGDEVFGDTTEAPARDGCRRLAHAAGTEVLGVRLARVKDDPAWRFVAANPSPLIEGGRPLAALIALLDCRGKARHDPVRRYS